MMLSRRGVVLVCLVTTLALIQSTAGVDAILSDRGVDVSVAEDPDAVLGMELSSIQVGENGSDGATLATFVNRFPNSVDLSVAVNDPSGPPTLENIAGPGTLSSGESGKLTADVVCNNETGTQSVGLDIEASSDGALLSATRDVEIACG